MIFPTKTCNKCNEIKSKKDFYKNIKTKDNLTTLCKSCCKQQVNKYREQNKDVIKERKSHYRKKHRKQKNAYEAEYKKRRRKHDSLFRCKENISALIRQSFKNKQMLKTTKTIDTLGCSPEWFYNEWLEKKYNPPHSHLDHIIPISLAQNEKEVILLNHYSNFQVLSSKQNISKGNKYISLQGLNKVLANHPYVKDVKYIIKREGIEVR